MKNRSLSRLMTLGLLLLAIGWTQQSMVSGSAASTTCLDCATLRSKCEADPDCRIGQFTCLSLISEITCVAVDPLNSIPCDFTAFVNECQAQGGAIVSSAGVTCAKICL